MGGSDEGRGVVDDADVDPGLLRRDQPVEGLDLVGEVEPLPGAPALLTGKSVGRPVDGR